MNLDEQLSGLIDAADADGIVAFLAGLNEDERLALCAAVETRLRHLVDEDYRARRQFGRVDRDEAQQRDLRLKAAHLALLGTANLATRENDDERIHAVRQACASERGHQILRDRRPPWLADLARQHLDYGHWMWDPVWRLIIDGLIERPSSPTFLRGMGLYAGRLGVHGLGDGLGRTSEPNRGDVLALLAEMVRRDPLLIDQDLPALLDLPDGLECLTRGDVRTLSWSPGKRTDERVWAPVLADLPAGHPLRNRVIAGLIEVLGGDVDRSAAMYHGFLTALRPTVAEYGLRTQALLRLAGHHTPAVVSFAVPVLSKMDKDGLLHPIDVMTKLAPATGAASMATARGAVKLITAAVRRQPELAGSAVTALAGAFSHRRAEVQLEAVEALLPYVADHIVRATLLATADSLAPSVAATVRAALEAVAPPAEPAEDDLDELLDQAEALLGTSDDPDLVVDLVAAMAAARTGAEPPPVVRQPWRDAMPGAAAVTPVADVDELIEVLLEIVDRQFRRTGTIDWALDGLAALAGEVPPDWGLRVSPLLARVNKVFESERPAWGDRVSRDFCFLVARWAEPEGPVAVAEPLDTPRQWLMNRMREVALMLASGERARLLSLPTGADNWIEPGVLAQRVIALGDGALTRPVDAAVALGRLAPWGRAAALTQLRDVPGTLAALVRAACGGDEDLSVAPEMLQRVVAWHRGPHDGEPFLFGDPMVPPPPEVNYSDLDSSQATIDALPRKLSTNGAEVVDFSQLPRYDEWVRWRDYREHERYGTAFTATQWPGDTSWLWHDAWYGNRMLGLLRDPYRAFPASAGHLVVRAISDSNAERRALATDVLAQTIADGRLTSGGLASLLTGPESGWLDSIGSAGRTVTNLAAISDRSPLHRAVIGRSLTQTVTVWCGLSAKPLCAMLELLDEIYTVDGLGLTGASGRAALSPLAAGRTKTATLVRRVLAHPPVDNWPAAATRATLSLRISQLTHRLHQVS